MTSKQQYLWSKFKNLFFSPSGAVIAVEPVTAMREAATRNLKLAAQENAWFDPSFVEIREGDAFVDVVAQNCLFNIFTPQDLHLALKEAFRVLKPQGRLLMSDPIATRAVPQHLQQDERLRAMCLSGALTYEQYIEHLVNTGFGQIEIRARRPYRLLDSQSYRVKCLSLIARQYSAGFLFHLLLLCWVLVLLQVLHLRRSKSYTASRGFAHATSTRH